jgi:hypothetical protein
MGVINMQKKQKGIAMGSLSNYVLAFVVVTIIIAIGGSILAGVQDTQTADTVEYNVTQEGLQGVETFGNWLVIIALVIVAVVVIGLLMMGFGGLDRGGT